MATKRSCKAVVCDARRFCCIATGYVPRVQRSIANEPTRRIAAVAAAAADTRTNRT